MRASARLSYSIAALVLMLLAMSGLRRAARAQQAPTPNRAPRFELSIDGIMRGPRHEPLLIAHGMLDTNALFQDTVRLVQRLIELRKDNVEVAPFPVENHAFEEETSWADEFTRVLKLFDTNLKGKL